ncbi:MAG: YgdI/YgdR family lipoprotein [Chloroflexi bacterium]|nr:YgdI/YgdR family lipoprotein [Chloroflexota bacterium]
MKKILIIVLSALFLVTLTACAPGSNVSLDKNNSQMLFTMPGANPELDTPVEGGSVAGLGTGLWHGLISIVTLIISFFNPEIQMYEVHNTGPLYNLGFLIGAVVLFALIGFSGGRRR